MDPANGMDAEMVLCTELEGEMFSAEYHAYSPTCLCLCLCYLSSVGGLCGNITVFVFFLREHSLSLSLSLRFWRRKLGRPKRGARDDGIAGGADVSCTPSM
ncbi:hypothetical protein L209DRAFT_752005 [Thermothelomyces heterothallicus CBS 203.75]